MDNLTNSRLKNLVMEVHKNNGNVPEHLVDQMFELHNNLFPNMKEFNKGCSKCRNRTFGRLQSYYNKLT